MLTPRQLKAFFSVGFALLLMLGFLAATFSLTSKRNIPNTEKEQSAIALRGSIISKDGFLISTSKELYRAEIDLRSINRDKFELFLKLFEIYSGASKAQMDDIKKRFSQKKQKNPNFILLQNIDSKRASYLSELAKKLYVQGFFKSFTNSQGKAEIRGLSITAHKEERSYMSVDAMTPALGYTRTNLDENLGVLRNFGVKGLEKSYEDCLARTQDEKIQGLKDVGGNIVLNLDSVQQRKINGCNLYLNLYLKLQKALEKMIDTQNLDLKANEIIVGIMESKTGKVLALASSRRYDPARRGKDLSVLNASVIEYSYEPGSVIKPFIFMTALRLDKLNLNERINTFGGAYKLGRFTIQDDHKFKHMSPEEIIIHSSNVGMIQIAKRMSDFEIIAGLKIFHFGEKSGVDLPYEQKGELPDPKKLRDIEKSVLSYGYGLKATFMQLLAAYNVFNNDGIYIIPRLAEKIYQGGEFREITVRGEKILGENASLVMKKMLIAAIEKGTGKKAAIKGLEIGGKTGTARIADKGGYSSNRYNASFFGFANDQNNSYTIGVLVRNPTKAYSYYAAQSALPIFKESVDILINEGFLSVNLDENSIKNENLKR